MLIKIYNSVATDYNPFSSDFLIVYLPTEPLAFQDYFKANSIKIGLIVYSATITILTISFLKIIYQQF